MNLRAGVDLGGTKIQAVVVDDRFQVVGEERRPTPTKGKPADVAAEIAAAVRGAAGAAEVEPAELSSIGVGSPGDVDDANGTVTTARNLPKWEGSFPLAAALQDALGPRVSLGNDVNVATMAEATLGAGTPYSSMLGVFWGTGVGGGAKGSRTTILCMSFGAFVGMVAVLLAGQLGGLGSLAAPIAVGLGATVIVLASSIPLLATIPASVYGFASIAGLILLGADAGMTPVKAFVPTILSILIGAAFGYVSEYLAGALTRKSAAPGADAASRAA